MGLFASVVSWVRQVIAPAPKPFVPTFESPVGTSPDGTHFWINPFYFATLATAQEVAKRFGAAAIFDKPYSGQNSRFTCDIPERWLTFKPGTKVLDYNGYEHKSSYEFEMNAGELAAFFGRNPEDQFPGLAEKLVLKALGQAAGA